MNEDYIKFGKKWAFYGWKADVVMSSIVCAVIIAAMAFGYVLGSAA